MAKAADLLGVRLADHLILGEGNTWVSLRERLAW
jgi:DNA repair protein RadC